MWWNVEERATEDVVQPVLKIPSLKDVECALCRFNVPCYPTMRAGIGSSPLWWANVYNRQNLYLNVQP